MFRLERTNERGRAVVRASGRIELEHVALLEEAIEAANRRVTLDLAGVTLVDRDVVLVLARWEAAGISFENCPAYLREWITQSRVRG